MIIFKEQYISIRKRNNFFDVRVVVPCNNKHLTKKQKRIASIGIAKSTARMFRDELLDKRKRINGHILTYEDGVAKFLEYEKSVRSARGLSSLKSCLQAHTSHWYTRLVADITSADLNKLAADMVLKVKPTTVDRNIRHIRGVFNYLLKTEVIHKNPALHVPRYSKKYVRQPLTAMNKQEVQKLLKYTTSIKHPLHAHIYLAYQTGARSGELKELRVKDFNFETSTVTISRSYDNKTKVIGTTKNKKARIVALNRSTIEFVKQLAAGKNRDEHILPYNKSFERGDGSKLLKGIQNDLQITVSNFHSLRASFITHLLNAGVAMTAVQELVGHTDLKTTQSYVRLCGSDLKGATDCLDMDPSDLSTSPADFSSALSSL